MRRALGLLRSWLLPLLAIYLAQRALQCHGHGFFITPLSRARALSYDEFTASAGNGLGARPFRTNPDGSLLNDQADVCGDPHQEAGDLNLRGRVTAIQATYTAGATITVVFRARVNHGGWLGIKLCPSTRANPSQACFDQYTLVNANTGYTRWWITSGSYGVQQDYSTNWRLPAGTSCDGGCVLQLTYRTANSCVDSCSVAECGSAYANRNNPVTNQFNLPSCQPARTEDFKDCADIRIVPSGGTVNPAAKPPPPPPGGSTGGGSTGGGSTCGLSAQAFCSGRAQGRYGDKCASCSSFYWCYGTGAAYMSCAPGTAISPTGSMSTCDWAANVVCQ